MFSAMAQNISPYTQSGISFAGSSLNSIMMAMVNYTKTIEISILSLNLLNISNDLIIFIYLFTFYNMISFSLVNFKLEFFT